MRARPCNQLTSLCVVLPQLIDTIATEIGELKQEMVQTEFSIRDEEELIECLR